MSSKLECKDCKNYNTWDTSSFIMPPELNFVIAKKPIIICGRCGGQNIKGSDHQFFSFNMEFNDSKGDYTPESTEYTWVLPDNRQRLPDVVWLDMDRYLHLKQPNQPQIDGIYFKDFDRYKKERYNGNEPLYPFKRVKHIDDVHDLYVCVCEDKRDLKYVVRYYDRFENDYAEGHDYDKSEIEGTFDLGDVEGLAPFIYVPPKNEPRKPGHPPSQSEIDRILEEKYNEQSN